MTTSRKRIFLHCGSHKTGSTAIQVFCAARRDRLRSHGIFYPKTGTGQNFPHGHHQLARLPENEDERQTAEKLWGELTEEMASQECGRILLSSEDFWFWTVDDHLRSLRDRLRDFDVSIVVYLRQQADYVSSLYCTSITHFQEDSDFPAFAKTCDMNYLRQMEIFEAAFGKDSMIVRPYEISQLYHGDIVYDMFHNLGFNNIPHERMLRPRHKVHATPAIEVVRLFFALNRLGRNDLTDALRRAWPLVQVPSPRPYSFFPRFDQLEIIRDCADSNAEIARHYIGRVDGVLFQEQPVIEPVTIEMTTTFPADLVALSILAAQGTGDGTDRGSVRLS